MQVSSTNSLTWLQSASGAAASTATAASASSADGQDAPDATGAENGSASLLASLQSPSQQFSASSLSALISAQLDQSSQGVQNGDGMNQASPDPAASQSAAAQLQASGAGRHHRHHGGGGAPNLTAAQPAYPANVDAEANSSTSDAQAGMAQLLTVM